MTFCIWGIGSHDIDDFSEGYVKQSVCLLRSGLVLFAYWTTSFRFPREFLLLNRRLFSQVNKCRRWQTFWTALKWKMPEKKHTRQGTKICLQKPLKTFTAPRNIIICNVSDVDFISYWLTNDGGQWKLSLVSHLYICASIHDLQSMLFLHLMCFRIRIYFILYFRSCSSKKLLSEVAMYMLWEKAVVMKWCAFSLVLYCINISPVIT